MNGDYTKVPLRPDERWTGARMQQGRVLLEHEWNLNLDAAARGSRAALADTIGPIGVRAGSDAFAVGVAPSGDPDLTLGAGRIWVDGLMALAPAAFSYSSQEGIEPLPAGGRALIYLDVFEEHVQPGETPAELVDPALAPVDGAARTRVGYRVRALPTKAQTCKTAIPELAAPARSTGTLSISRAAAPAPADPCDPPGDPLGRVPDGLFRVEVLDAGDAGDARFAWSFENGAACVGVATIAGSDVTLLPSQAVAFQSGDLVEVSWLARRADRADHGALFEVESVTQGAGGAILTLDRQPTPPPGAAGLAVRRWDGEALGAAGEQPAAFRGADIGVRFAAADGRYEVGDWWGARLREGEDSGIEQRTEAEPDGCAHAFAPLALVDLDKRLVVSDCRPTFQPLTGLDTGGGACTVVAHPGDDLQMAIDALPDEGGELCLAAGTFPLTSSLLVEGRRRVTIVGTGPATVLQATGVEAALVFDTCSEVEVRHLRVEGGSAGEPPGDPHLNGAITFVASTDALVSDCVVTCPGSSEPTQTCITVREREAAEPVEPTSRVRIERNRLEPGAWQTGLLVLDCGQATIVGNRILWPRAAESLVGGQILRRAIYRTWAEALKSPNEGGELVSFDPPGGEIHLVAGSEAVTLMEDFNKVFEKFEPVRRGLKRAVRAWAGAVAEGRIGELSPESGEIVARLRRDWCVGGRGIVVSGHGGETAQILDNVIENVVQGIHISSKKMLGDMVLRGNRIELLVPAGYDRDRHAIFVGNVEGAQVLDTVAGVERPGGGQAVAETPVEGIRLYGRFGSYMTVRGSRLSAFAVGVKFEPLFIFIATLFPVWRMWVITETLAIGGRIGVEAAGPVEQERNFPKPVVIE